MIEKMRELVDFLNARTAEYDAGTPTISDQEWDDAFFQLLCLERKAGIALDDSPTQIVYHKTVDKLEKIEHEHAMLSLAKTKDMAEVTNFIGDRDYVPMIKLDGLTCSLTYENGRLVRAETRGNGIVGENVLHNARVNPTIPQVIDYKDRLVVDGEFICTYKDFEKFSNDYSNPRNFAAGSIRLLDSKEFAQRDLSFIVWEVIEGFDEEDYLHNRLIKAQELGFFIVPFDECNWDIETNLETLKAMAEEAGYPYDGVVFKFDSKNYGTTLGKTEHHFKNAIAFKFYDEEYDTILTGIEWTMGRTGVLTPVAIFDPVDTGDSVINRASMHNVSVMRSLLERPYIGQKIRVCKQNEIIPQITWGDKSIPDLCIDLLPPNKCPICGKETTIKENNGVLTLYCSNLECEGQFINRLDHFCGKKGLDIKGLSKATLEKLIEWNWISCIEDIFTLNEYASEWAKKPGFGDKSVSNILMAIEKAKSPTLDKFIAALGIPLIGSAASKAISDQFTTYDDFKAAIASKYDFTKMDGFGDALNYSIYKFNFDEADRIFENYLSISVQETPEAKNNSLDGKNFVITGKLRNFKNRDMLVAEIQAHGGKVSSSVSSKTSYLINNNKNSTSSKNIEAKNLGIEIISEEDLIEMMG